MPDEPSRGKFQQTASFLAILGEEERMIFYDEEFDPGSG